VKDVHDEQAGPGEQGNVAGNKSRGEVTVVDGEIHLVADDKLFLCTDYADDMDAEGSIGLEHHGEDGQVHRFRNIRIKEP
jgi:hypothetical protein